MKMKRLSLILIPCLLAAMIPPFAFANARSQETSLPVEQTIACDQLPAPKITRAVVKNPKTVKLKWKTVSGAKDYEVYRSTSAKGQYVSIKTTADNSCRDKGPKSGETYYYRVKAKSGVSGSRNSKLGKYKAAKPSLKQPVISLRRVSSNKIKISWKKVHRADGYHVYRSTKRGGGYWRIRTAIGTTVVDAGLKRGLTYYYKVRAYKQTSGKTYLSRYSAVKAMKL